MLSPKQIAIRAARQAVIKFEIDGQARVARIIDNHRARKVVDADDPEYGNSHQIEYITDYEGAPLLRREWVSLQKFAKDQQDREGFSGRLRGNHFRDVKFKRSEERSCRERV